MSSTKQQASRISFSLSLAFSKVSAQSNTTGSKPDIFKTRAIPFRTEGSSSITMTFLFDKSAGPLRNAAIHRSKLDPIGSNSYWLRGQYGPQHAAAINERFRPLHLPP